MIRHMRYVFRDSDARGKQAVRMRGKRGYLDDATRSLYDGLRAEWTRVYDRRPESAPMTLRVELHLAAKPSSRKYPAGAMCTRKPDCDNVLKAVGDALTGYAWVDDAQIVDARCMKHMLMEPGEPEYMDIAIRSLEDEDR